MIGMSGLPIHMPNGEYRRNRNQDEMICPPIIEAVCSIQGPPLIAAQWHPAAYMHDPDPSPHKQLLRYALFSGAWNHQLPPPPAVTISVGPLIVPAVAAPPLALAVGVVAISLASVDPAAGPTVTQASGASVVPPSGPTVATVDALAATIVSRLGSCIGPSPAAAASVDEVAAGEDEEASLTALLGAVDLNGSRKEEKKGKK